ncbi:MAG: hypothetical protein WD492_01320, partial [Alkalispirochaeta sp.]
MQQGDMSLGMHSRLRRTISRDAQRCPRWVDLGPRVVVAPGLTGIALRVAMVLLLGVAVVGVGWGQTILFEEDFEDEAVDDYVNGTDDTTTDQLPWAPNSFDNAATWDDYPINPGSISMYTFAISDGDVDGNTTNITNKFEINLNGAGDPVLLGGAFTPSSDRYVTVEYDVLMNNFPPNYPAGEIFYTDAATTLPDGGTNIAIHLQFADRNGITDDASGADDRVYRTEGQAGDEISNVTGTEYTEYSILPGLSWQTNTWYRVRVVADNTGKVFDVRIEQLSGIVGTGDSWAQTGLPYNDAAAGAIQKIWFGLTAGNPLLYFDNINIYEDTVSPDSFEWTGGGAAGDWNDPNNWDVAEVPLNDGSAIVTIPNTGNDPVLPGDYNLDSLTIGTGARLNLGGYDLDVDIDIAGAGTLEATAAETVTVGGDWSIGVFTEANSLVVFDGGGAREIATATTFNNLQVNKSTGTLNTTAAITTAGNTTMTAGALSLGAGLTVEGNLLLGGGDLQAIGQTITLSGDFDRSGGGTFSEGTSTVAFVDSGVTSQILGATTFSGLESTVGGKIIQFGAGSTQTVTGTLTLTGVSGNQLVLRSTTTDSTWQLDPSGATITVDYVDVQDSDVASTTAVLTPSTAATNSGNNDVFDSSLTVSVFGDDDGLWDFTNGTGVTTNWTGTNSTNWYDPGNWDAGIPGKDDTAQIPDNTTAPTQPVADDFVDVDTLALQDGTSVLGMAANNLTVNTSYTSSGTLRLEGSETVSLPVATVPGTVEYVGDGGGTTTTYPGLAAGNAYTNLTFNSTDTGGNADEWQPGGAVTVSGGLTISEGVVNLASSNVGLDVTGATSVDGTLTGGTAGVTFSGSFSANASSSFTASSATTLFEGTPVSIAGTFSANSGTVEFDAGGAQSYTGAGSAFNNVTVGDTASGGTVVSLGSDFDVNGTLQIVESAELQSGANTIFAAGNVNFSGGTFDAGSGEMDFDGTTHLTTGTNALYDLRIDGTAPGTVTPQDGLVVNRHFVIEASGSYANNGQPLTLGGTADAGNLTDANGGTQDLGAVTVSTAAKTMTTAIQASSLTINSTLNTGANNLTVGGSIDASGGGTLDAGGGGTIDAGGSVTFGTFADAAGSTLQFSGSTTPVTLTSNTQTLGALTVAKSASTDAVQLQDALTVGGDVTITTGTLNASGGPHNVTVGGGWSNSDTYTSGTNLTTFDATSGPVTITTGGTGVGSDFHDLTFNDGGSGVSFVLATNALDVDGDLTITGGTLDSASGAGGPHDVTVGGNWNNSDIYTSGANTVTLTASAANTSLIPEGTAAGNDFNNLTINATNTVALAGGLALLVNGNLSVSGGTFDTGGGAAIEVGGDWTVGAGVTFTRQTSTVTLSGTGNVSVDSPATNAFYGLTFSGTADTTLNSDVAVEENWDNSAGGTVDASTATLTLIGGTTSQLLGSTIFSGLESTVGGKIIQFGAGSTQTVTGTLTLTGVSGNQLVLRSTTTDSTWQLDPSGATITVDYVDVQDSDVASTTAVLTPSTAATNSGNNDVFDSSLTVSVFGDDDGLWDFTNGTGVTTNWTGTNSTNWYDPGNWDAGIPGKDDTAQIPDNTTAPTQPVADDFVDVDTLALQDGTSVLGMAANNLTVNTSYTSSGTLRLEGSETVSLPVATVPGTVEYVGDGGGTTTTYPGLAAGNAYTNLTFNSTDTGGNADEWQPGGAVTVTGTLARDEGTVTLAGNELTVGGDITHTAGALTSSGTVTLNGTGAQTIEFTNTTLDAIAASKTGGSVSFTAGFTANSFTVGANDAFGISFNTASGGGGETTQINNDLTTTDLDNTGTLSTGNEATDVFLADAGIDTTAVGGGTTVAGTVRTSGDQMDFGTLTVTADSEVDTTNDGGTATGANMNFTEILDDGAGRSLALDAGTGNIVIDDNVGVNGGNT